MMQQWRPPWCVDDTHVLRANEILRGLTASERVFGEVTHPVAAACTALWQRRMSTASGPAPAAHIFGWETLADRLLYGTNGDFPSHGGFTVRPEVAFDSRCGDALSSRTVVHLPPAVLWLPLCVSRTHHVVACIDVPNRSITMYDSLTTPIVGGVVQQLMDAHDLLTTPTAGGGWQLAWYPLTQQLDGVSCGLFTCVVMLGAALGVDPNDAIARASAADGGKGLNPNGMRLTLLQLIISAAPRATQDALLQAARSWYATHPEAAPVTLPSAVPPVDYAGPSPSPSHPLAVTQVVACRRPDLQVVGAGDSIMWALQALLACDIALAGGVHRARTVCCARFPPGGRSCNCRAKQRCALYYALWSVGKQCLLVESGAVTLPPGVAADLRPPHATSLGTAVASVLFALPSPALIKTPPLLLRRSGDEPRTHEDGFDQLHFLIATTRLGGARSGPAPLPTFDAVGALVLGVPAGGAGRHDMADLLAGYFHPSDDTRRWIIGRPEYLFVVVPDSVVAATVLDLSPFAIARRAAIHIETDAVRLTRVVAEDIDARLHSPAFITGTFASTTPAAAAPGTAGRAASTRTRGAAAAAAVATAAATAAAPAEPAAPLPPLHYELELAIHCASPTSSHATTSWFRNGDGGVHTVTNGLTTCTTQGAALAALSATASGALLLFRRVMPARRPMSCTIHLPESTITAS